MDLHILDEEGNEFVAEWGSVFSNVDLTDVRAKEISRVFVDLFDRHTDVLLFATECAELLPSSLYEKISWASKDFEATVAHARSVCQLVLESTVLEVEDCFFGKLFAPADLVVKNEDGKSFTLIDFTSDESLAVNKMKALESKASDLMSNAKGCFLKCEIRAVNLKYRNKEWTRSSWRDDDAPEHVRMKTDLIDALDSADIDWKRVEFDLFSRINKHTKDLFFSPKDKVKGASAVARGEKVRDDLISVVTELDKRMPEVYQKLCVQLFEDYKFAKGIAPPMQVTGLLGHGFGDNSLGSFLHKVKSSEAGTVLAWSRACGTFETNYIVGNTRLASSIAFDILMESLGGGYVKFVVSEGADTSLLDFAERDYFRERVDENVRLEPDEIVDKYLNLERVFKDEYSCAANTNIPSVFDRSQKILNSIQHLGDANLKALELGNLVLSACDASVASKFLSMARLVHELAFLSSGSGGDNTACIRESCGGRVIQLTNVTGTVGRRNDKSCIVCVSKAFPQVGNWESYREDGDVVSKSVFIKMDRGDWLSEAPGAVATISAAHLDTAQNGLQSVGDFASAASLLSVASRKSYGVMMSQEKLLTSAAVSFVSDFGANISKMESVPLCGVEQLIASRLILRSSAACLERDTGDLSEIVVSSGDGPKSIAISPALSPGGLESAHGNVNSFYHCKLSSRKYSSSLVAEVLAFKKAMQGTKDMLAWIDEDDSKAFGCAKETLLKWRKEPDGFWDWVGSEEFFEHELKYAEELMLGQVKHTCSLLFIYMAAANYESPCDWSSAIRAACQSSVAPAFTTKKAFDQRQEGKSKNSRDFAFAVHSKEVTELAGGHRWKDFMKAADWVLDTESKIMPVSIDALALRELMASTGFKLYVTKKDHTIESVRDITMADSDFRFGQMFIEKVSREISKGMVHSALQQGDKMSSLFEMEKEVGVLEEGDIALKIASDVSTYGPGKDALGMYATLVALGMPRAMQSFSLKFFQLLARKEIKVSDVISCATYEQIAKIDQEVADVAASSGYYVTLVGMMQGLMTYTADVQSATVVAAIERFISSYIGKASFRSTNDDGAGVVVVPQKFAKDASLRIAKSNQFIGVLAAEIRNLAKFHVTSFMGNLNTNITFSNHPVMPYVRSLMACSSTSQVASTRESYLSVLASTNTGLSEGAPLFVLFCALALSYEAHYSRFRCIDKAVRGEYLSPDIFKLGPPIFYPSVSYVFGPIPLAVTFWNAKGTLEDKASVAFLANVPYDDLSSMSVWGNKGEPDPEAYGFVDYFMKVHPTTREARDPRMHEVVNNEPLLDMAEVTSPLSLTSLILKSLNQVVRSSKSKPFRPASTLHLNAATAYSEANRVMIRSVLGPEGHRVSSEITWESFLEEIPIETDVSGYGIDSPLVDNFVAKCMRAASAVNSVNSADGLCGVQRYMKTHTVPSADRTSEAKYELWDVAQAIFPDKADKIRAYLALKGIIYQGKVSFSAPVSEVLRDVELAESVMDSCLWTGYQRVYTCGLDIGTSQEAACLISLANIGRGYASTTVVKTAQRPLKFSFDKLPDVILENLRKATSSAAASALDWTLPEEPPYLNFKTVFSSVEMVMSGDAESALDCTSVAKSSLENVLRCAAASAPIPLLTTPFIEVLLNSKCANILHRVTRGTAIARERKLVLLRKGKKGAIKHLAVRCRRDISRGYHYDMVVFVDNPDEVRCVGRTGEGSKLAEKVDDRKGAFVKDEKGFFVEMSDKVVRVVKWPETFSVQALCFPPAICFSHEGIYVPIMDLVDYDLNVGVLRPPITHEDSFDEDVDVQDFLDMSVVATDAFSIGSIKKAVATASVSSGVSGSLNILFDEIFKQNHLLPVDPEVKLAVIQNTPKWRPIFLSVCLDKAGLEQGGLYSMVFQTLNDGESISRAVGEWSKKWVEIERKRLVDERREAASRAAEAPCRPSLRSLIKTAYDAASEPDLEEDAVPAQLDDTDAAIGNAGVFGVDALPTKVKEPVVKGSRFSSASHAEFIRSVMLRSWKQDLEEDSYFLRSKGLCDLKAVLMGAKEGERNEKSFAASEYACLFGACVYALGPRFRSDLNKAARVNKVSFVLLGDDLQPKRVVT